MTYVISAEARATYRPRHRRAFSARRAVRYIARFVALAGLIVALPAAAFAATVLGWPFP